MRSLKALLFSVVVAGCTGSGAVRYSATAEVSTPELVEVEPGVMVVADYDEPVFFSDSYYWRYDAGIWYRSPYYNRGWVRIATPPVAVRRIERPEMYVHYRAGVRDRREARANPPPPTPIRDRGPEVRDHHMTPPAPAPLPAAPPPDVRREGPPPGQNPAVREDRRDERREDQAERRDDRADRKAEAREDRAERKDERRDDKAQRKDERRDDKAQRKDERRDDKHDHGHH